MHPFGSKGCGTQKTKTAPLATGRIACATQSTHARAHRQDHLFYLNRLRGTGNPACAPVSTQTDHSNCDRKMVGQALLPVLRHRQDCLCHGIDCPCYRRYACFSFITRAMDAESRSQLSVSFSSAARPARVSE